MTEAVEGIFLDLSTSKELNFSIDAFAKMKRLRLLKICDLQIDRSLEYVSEKELITYPHNVWTGRKYLYNKVHLYGDPKFMSNSLSDLCWHGYPLKSLPSNRDMERRYDCSLYAFFFL